MERLRFFFRPKVQILATFQKTRNPLSAPSLAVAEQLEQLRSMADALRDALHKSQSKIKNIFRDWDADMDGTVSVEEFRKACGSLDVACGYADTDLLFASLDQDGTGQVEYRELHRLLRVSMKIAPELKPGAAGEIKLACENRIQTRKATVKKEDSNLLQLELKPGVPVAEQLVNTTNRPAHPPRTVAMLSRAGRRIRALPRRQRVARESPLRV